MVTMMKEKIYINNAFRDTGEVLNNTKISFREKERGLGNVNIIAIKIENYLEEKSSLISQENKKKTR